MPTFSSTSMFRMSIEPARLDDRVVVNKRTIATLGPPPARR